MKERSEAQREASKRNGAKGTGPRTEEGKAISSQNSFIHGFTADTVTLLHCDDPEAFEEYFNAQFERFQPQSDAEKFLVRDIAAAGWRLRAINEVQALMIRMQALDAGGFVDHFGKNADNDPDICVPFGVVRMANQSNGFNLLMRYATSLQRQYAALLKELTDLQKTRPVRNEPEKPKKPLTNQQPTSQEPETPTILMQPDPPLPTPENQPNMQ